MGATWSRIKTWIAGDTLTASDLNGEFDNVLNNQTPSGLDDYSVNNAQMQSTADPYPGSSESLATSTAGEFERLRYLLQQQHVTSQWYIFPDLVSKTAAYTATQDDMVILCDASGGAFSITLPAASGLTDKIFYIKKTDSSALAVTIDGNASETIDGTTTVTLDSQYSYAIIVCDGSNWIIIGGNSTTQKWKKGADVASATALPLIGDGNYFDVTGTTTVTSFNSLGIGVVVRLHFDGVLILTHHAADLVLPTSANITTAAGDEAEFVQYADGDWRCTNYSKASGLAVAGGKVIQTAYNSSSTVATGTTQLPTDNTIPQNTEGNEVITQAITPTDSSSKLVLEAAVCASHDGTLQQNLSIAVFQDSTANALASSVQSVPGQYKMVTIPIRYEMTAGTTSSTTFKIRIGIDVAGTHTVNGSNATQVHGGVMATHIKITEIEA